MGPQDLDDIGDWSDSLADYCDDEDCSECYGTDDDNGAAEVSDTASVDITGELVDAERFYETP